MAGSKVSTYSAGDTDPTALMVTTDGQRIGYMGVSITEYATNVIPKIAEGSKVEVNGSLFKFDADEAIGGAPADGLVYIKLLPVAAVITAIFTASAPTWDDEKQGWYEAATNNRYLPFAMTKAGAVYSDKYEFNKYKECIKFMADGDVDLNGTLNKNGIPVHGFMADGTPLYSKKITVTISNGSTAGWTAHNISNAYASDKILSAIAIHKTDERQAPIAPPPPGIPAHTIYNRGTAVVATVQSIRYCDTYIYVIAYGVQTANEVYDIFVIYK